MFGLIYCFVSYLLSGQTTDFSKVIFDKNGSSVQVYTAIPLPNNGIILCGTSNRLGIVIKLDAHQNIIWNKSFDNNIPNVWPGVVLTNILSTNDSCYTLTGYSYNSDTKSLQGLCFKLNNAGDLLWSTSFYAGNLQTNSIDQTFDSGYILTGYSTNPSAPYSQIFVAKIDQNGVLQWSKKYSKGDHQNYAYSIKQLADSTFVLAGSYEIANPFKNKAFLLNISKSGEEIWAKSYFSEGKNEHSYAYDFLETKKGYLVYLNSTYLSIMETDQTGNPLWNKSYSAYVDGNLKGFLPGISAYSDQNYLLVYGDGIVQTDTTGNISSTSGLNIIPAGIFTTVENKIVIYGNGPRIGVIAKPQASRETIGLIQLDSLGYDSGCAYSNTIEPIGQVLLSQSINFESSKGVVAASNNFIESTMELGIRDGCIDFIGAVDDLKLKPSVLVYPNPSDGRITIESATNIVGQISIFNASGIEICETELKGYTSEVDLTNQLPGIYFYQITRDEKVFSSGEFILK